MIKATNARIIEIKAEDTHKYTKRCDFMPVCQYGKGIDISDGEIGALVQHYYDCVLNKETGLFEGTVEIKDRVIVKE